MLPIHLQRPTNAGDGWHCMPIVCSCVDFLPRGSNFPSPSIFPGIDPGLFFALLCLCFVCWCSRSPQGVDSQAFIDVQQSNATVDELFCRQTGLPMVGLVALLIRGAIGHAVAVGQQRKIARDD